MSKVKKTSAAIVSLLDAIKSEGIEPVEGADIIAPEKSDYGDTTHEEIHTGFPIKARSTIPYHVIQINPDECRPWDFANRLTEYLTEDSCHDLIESIRNIGQQIPVLVRQSASGKGYELICGARRLFACKQLGIMVKAAVVDLSDKEALLAMDAENRPRQDITPYERAKDYKRWVESGAYKNYAEIIREAGLKKSWFSQLMSLAELDESIIKAFGHPANLKLRWGYHLHLLCKKDSAFEKAMITSAINIYGLNLPPVSVFNMLKNATKAIPKPEPARWINVGGKKLIKVKLSKSGKAHISLNRKLPDEVLEKILDNMKESII